MKNRSSLDRINERVKTDYVPRKNLKWAVVKFKALGVWFCTEEGEGVKMNYQDKFHKVELNFTKLS